MELGLSLNDNVYHIKAGKCTYSYSLYLIAACHVRGMRLSNHASPEKMFRTTGSACSRLKIFASHIKMSKRVSQMPCDSVRSLVMCNLFSHALFWSAWPPARSGFLFTLNMSEAEVSPGTMTDTNSVQTWKTGHLRFILAHTSFLPLHDTKVELKSSYTLILFYVWVQIMSLTLA